MAAPAHIAPVVRFFWEGRSLPGWHEPLRRIYDCELVFVSEGSFTLTVADTSVHMTRGAVAIVPPAVWHESSTGPGESTVRQCIHFDWTEETFDRTAPFQALPGQPFYDELVHSPPPDILVRLPLLLAPTETREILPALEMGVKAIRSGRPHGELFLWPALRLILGAARKAPLNSSNRSSRAILALKHYIETNYDKPITSKEFTEVTRLSAGRLCQAFSSIAGCPPNAYLNRVRIQHASRLLKESAMSIKEIASAVGIHDANYFARIFRKYTGHSPSDLNHALLKTGD